MQDIKSLSLKELEGILQGWGSRAFHARQIFSWIYQRGVVDFSQMTDLPEDLRKRLKDNFYILGLELKDTAESSDGTEKYLFGLADGNIIETVIIPAEERVTGCISTQAGCRFSCRFCASGVSGFKRNLSCGEIIEEVLLLNSRNKLTHLVFMGTGEPLDNYDNLMKAIRIINSKEAFNIGARRITISTCGLIPGIKKLAQEGMQIELSVSLHASDDKTRSFLLPVNKKYPLAQLMKACKEYAQDTGRQVTFEYLLIKGVNSGVSSARRLSKMMKDVGLAKVNLIPANPVSELGVQPPNKLDVLFFKDCLVKQGVVVTLRKPRGEDIEAACGQLRLRYEKK